MPYGMILGIVAVAIAVAAVRYVRALFAPASSLGLSLFRPYRGDPWPRGVQEQYDVHFDWEPPKPKRRAGHDPAELVRHRRSRPRRTQGRLVRSAAVDIEDLVGETAAIEDVRGSVHIAPH